MADRRNAKARQDALEGGHPSTVRRPILASWTRARRRGIAPDTHLPPISLEDDALRELRERHPLAAVWPLLRQSFQSVTSAPGRLLFVGDAQGRLLWVDGERSTLRQAERVHLVPGASWSEEVAGTSGVGTTLAMGRPFQVFGAEHFLSVATAYTCTAVPLRSPVTGELLGVVDVTCAERHWHPAVAALLTTATRLAQAELHLTELRRQERLRTRYLDRIARRFGTHSAIVAVDGTVVHADPPGWLPGRLPGGCPEGPVVLPTGQSVVVERLGADGTLLVTAHELGSDQAAAAEAVISLEALGRDQAELRMGGLVHRLSRRHSEILALLMSQPRESSEALAAELYPQPGKSVTVRAELARLRTFVGHRLASNPYRMTGTSVADFLEVERGATTDRLEALLRSYPGPLLPGSEAPGVVTLRERVHRRVRSRILASGDLEALAAWVGTAHGRDDAEARTTLARLAATGPR